MAAKNTQGQREAVERTLLDISGLSREEVFERLGTSEYGLNQVEATDRLEEYGPNVIDIDNQNRLLKRIREALINPFNLVLIIVAIVTLFTDVVFADQPSPATFIMLVLVIIISGVISFVQTEKSNSAAQ